jgi:aryl-alcohol dehydrogenase-like predicted oxidoreductase
MRYRRLGKTGLRVSEIGFGAWAIGGPFALGSRPAGWGEVDDETSLAALRTAFEAGVNFVDTADVYGHGHSEDLIRQAAADAPQEIIVATKAGYLREQEGDTRQDFSAGHLAAACEESLRRLGRESIDVLQLHSPPLEVIESGEAFEALEDLKQAGKIRHYGISAKRDGEAVAAMEYPGVETVQIVFNMLRQKAARTVFPTARQKNIAVVARVPLASGLLTGKFTRETKFTENDHRSQPIPGETFSGLEFSRGVEVVEKLRFLESVGGPSLAQIALRWVLAFDAVSSVIAGAKTPEQVLENVSTSGGMLLSDAAMDRIHFVYRQFVASDLEDQW